MANQYGLGSAIKDTLKEGTQRGLKAVATGVLGQGIIGQTLGKVIDRKFEGEKSPQTKQAEKKYNDETRTITATLVRIDSIAATVSRNVLLIAEFLGAQLESMEQVKKDREIQRNIDTAKAEELAGEIIGSAVPQNKESMTGAGSAETGNKSIFSSLLTKTDKKINRFSKKLALLAATVVGLGSAAALGGALASDGGEGDGENPSLWDQIKGALFGEDEKEASDYGMRWESESNGPGGTLFFNDPLTGEEKSEYVPHVWGKPAAEQRANEYVVGRLAEMNGQLPNKPNIGTFNTNGKQTSTPGIVFDYTIADYTATQKETPIPEVTPAPETRPVTDGMYQPANQDAPAKRASADYRSAATAPLTPLITTPVASSDRVGMTVNLSAPELSPITVSADGAQIGDMSKKTSKMMWTSYDDTPDVQVSTQNNSTTAPAAEPELKYIPTPAADRGSVDIGTVFRNF